MVKVWNYNSLIMGDYDDHMQAGLTGGYDPGPNSPRMIFMKENIESPPMDDIAVSSCGAYIGVITSRQAIDIHKAAPNFSIPTDKGIRSRTVELELRKSSSQVLRLRFYRDPITNTNFIYVVTSDMIYLLDTEKKITEMKEITISEVEVLPHCVDLDEDTGSLLVSQSYHGDHNVPAIGEAIYQLDNPPTLKFYSEGNRVFSKLYGKLMVIVTEKEQRKRHYLEVYDASIQILFYSQAFHTIHDIVVENNGIYLFVTHDVQNGVPDKELILLTEITVGEKIKILLEKSLFEEASQVAINAECSEEIKAAVAREQGDHFYNNRKFKEAMAQYIKTIGYEAPSYVIEKFLDVQNLDLLIEYLEKLIEMAITTNNKDYTALLLNCYLKQQKKEKIEEQMIKDRGSDTIFDVKTAIDVCRQKQGYNDLAIKLAKKYEKWEMLVNIYIEDELPNYNEAVNIIEEKVRDVRMKVKLLQQYGGVLLSMNDSKFFKDNSGKMGKEVKTKELLLKITTYLIEKAKNPEFSSPKYANYVLEGKKSIKLSELIKIFIDRNDLLCKYLEDIIKDHKDDALKICGDDIQIYHKLLECYLNEYAEKRANKLSTGVQNIEESIKNFVKHYESKIDKNYVLYLFRFYNYLDGIQKLSQQLHMNQELLSVYIEKREYDNMILLCRTRGAEERDLWIQTLNHFREEGENLKLQECLDIISETEVLSPLLVLDILENNTDSDLKFKYIKDYMLKEIKKLDTNIKESKEEVDINLEEIQLKREQYRKLTSAPQMFEVTSCSK